MEIQDILELLHQTSGEPRLEIAGCTYPPNEKILQSYQDCHIPAPKKIDTGHSMVRIDGSGTDEDRLRWMDNDGYGGLIGGINIESEYTNLLATDRSNKCAYVMEKFWDRPDNYTTVIRVRCVLFKKSDLIEVIKAAQNSATKQSEAKVQVIWVIDNVKWEDGLADSKGPTVMNPSMRFCIDLTMDKPKFHLDF